MLTDTATSERPGPWSEPVLLNNVERHERSQARRVQGCDSPVERHGIASCRPCCGANADHHHPRSVILSQQRLDGFPLEPRSASLQPVVLDFQQGLDQGDLTSPISECYSLRIVVLLTTAAPPRQPMFSRTLASCITYSAMHWSLTSTYQY